MPNILNHTLWISLNKGLIVIYSGLLPISNFFSLKSSLQNLAYSQTPLRYYRNDLKSRSIIQKSIKKRVKALNKHPKHLLFPMFSWFHRSFSHLIQKP